jgi:hypothetical protein
VPAARASTPRAASAARASTRGPALALALALLVACGENKPAPTGQASASATASSSGRATASTAKASAKPAPSASAKAPERPWEELARESKPLAPTPAAQKVGPHELSAEPCVIEGGNPLGKSSMDVARALAVVGERLYLVDAAEAVRAYVIDKGEPCKLTPDTAFGAQGVLLVDPKVRALAVGKDLLVASNGVFGAVVLKGGKVEAKCDARPGGYVSMHGSGTWGLSFFSSSNLSKLSFTGVTCKVEPWTVLGELGRGADKRKGPLASVTAVGFQGDVVLVGGILAKDVDPNASRVVVAFDAAGNEKARLGDTTKNLKADDHFGWVHAIRACAPGLCVVDGNFQRMAIFDGARKLVGALALGKLLGLPSPWVQDLALTKGGAYLVAGESREGSKVHEGIVYRVKGL